MKKYLRIIPILVIVFLLTGCGEKKLVCTVEEIDEKIEATFKFKNDEVSTIILKDTYKADSKEEAEEGKKDLDLVMGTAYSGQPGITYNSKLKGKDVIVTITMDVATLDEEAKEEYLSNGKTYEEIKANAERNGYSCK